MITWENKLQTNNSMMRRCTLGLQCVEAVKWIGEGRQEKNEMDIIKKVLWQEWKVELI